MLRNEVDDRDQLFDDIDDVVIDDDDDMMENKIIGNRIVSKRLGNLDLTLGVKDN